MNVLHVIDHMGLGGAQSILRSVLAHNFTNSTHLCLALRRTGQETMDCETESRLQTCRSRSVYSLAPLFALVRSIRVHKPQIIHAHLFRSQVFAWLSSFFTRTNAKLFFHMHGRIAGRTLYLTFLRMARKRVDRFIVVSNDVGNQLHSHIGRSISKSRVIHNFVTTHHLSVSKTQHQFRARFDLPKESRLVGFVGRLTEQKGWKDFISIARHLGVHLGVAFVIAGSGPDEERVRASCLGVDNCYFLGRITDVGNMLNALSCLVVPSYWEPMGLVQLEAQYVGVPVIAYDIPGLGETVCHERDAILVPKGDTDGLTAAVQRLLADESLQLRLRAGGFRNVQLYSLHEYSSVLEQLYSETLVGNL